MIAVVSNHFFATSDSVTALINSRVLIGYTHPFILTSVLTLGTHWLPRRHFSLFVGVLFGVLLMVPMADYAPLQSLNSLSTLRRAILAVNLIGIFIICSIVLTEQILDRTRHRHTLKALFKPLTYHKVWLICLVSMVGWIANTFLLHYGAFYLIWHFDFSMKHAIDIVHTSFIFFGIGVVFMGMLSDYLAKKRYLISLFYTLTALMICILVFVPGLPIRLVPILFFLTSFFASSTIICYTKANDYCTIGNSGITLGLVLSITTIGSSLFVRITGSVLQKYVNDSVQANPNNWEMLLAVLPVILFLLLGATIAMLLKPVHFKAHHHRDDLDPNNPHPLPATAALPEVSPELNSTASTIKLVNPKPKKKPKKKS
jgi:predicted MFS family arabinose efflux permease